jgi:hypothetical protein
MRDAGEGSASYIAVFLLIAGIAGALIVSGVPGDIAGAVESAVCRVGSDTDCEPRQRDEVRSTPPSEEEWGDRSTDPAAPAPPPTEAEKKAGREAAGKIRANLDCPWYERLWCDAGEDPEDLIGRMKPGEISALFDELSDEEIRSLLERPEVLEALFFRADLALLHHLERLRPGTFEPYFKDVPKNQATGWGAVPDGRLWGSSGQPSLEDIDQGSLADCWFMASMGALAHTEEGRERIKNMIKMNPNGTYSVTFPDGEVVDVTPFFPVDGDGDLTYARPNGHPPVIWPLLLEKAYAQYLGTYGHLDQDAPSKGLEDLTGVDSEWHEPGDMSLDDLRNRLEEGAVIVSTPDADEVEGKEIYDSRLNTNHAYVVKSVTEDGKVELYNPWGDNHETITMDEFRQYLEGVTTNPIE